MKEEVMLIHVKEQEGKTKGKSCILMERWFTTALLDSNGGHTHHLSGLMLSKGIRDLIAKLKKYHHAGENLGMLLSH